MRYLGIDYGGKRVGVAVSDETKTFANPFSVLENNENLISEIEKVCREKEIEAIVVGESKDFNFKDNKIMGDIREFVKIIEEKLKLPVHLHPEFLTSQEAERIQGKNDMHDASAAAIILGHFLEVNKK
ncbi:MAG TPA: Holliday junction resolvase RuvX [Candidatus Paceibacterota bacterium]